MLAVKKQKIGEQIMPVDNNGNVEIQNTEKKTKVPESVKTEKTNKAKSSKEEDNKAKRASKANEARKAVREREANSLRETLKTEIELFLSRANIYELDELSAYIKVKNQTTNWDPRQHFAKALAPKKPEAITLMSYVPVIDALQDRLLSNVSNSLTRGQDGLVHVENYKRVQTQLTQIIELFNPIIDSACKENIVKDIYILEDHKKRNKQEDKTVKVKPVNANTDTKKVSDEKSLLSDVPDTTDSEEIKAEEILVSESEEQLDTKEEVVTPTKQNKTK